MMQSHTLSIDGSLMHYVEAGQGNPVLFIHGMPTSSYLWRDIIPAFNLSNTRCIAPDLMGMGQSDQPDIPYRISDQVYYLDQFIQKLNLKNITLVLHGWGSLVGFECARRHADKISAIAFYESYIKPVTQFSQLSLPMQEMSIVIKEAKRSVKEGVDAETLVRKFMSIACMRSLGDNEMQHYTAPFKRPRSRVLLSQYLNDLPLGDGPADVVDMISRYSEWLATTTFPKLMLYAIPGFMTTIETVQWAKHHFKNLTLICLDDVLHFAQESSPEVFANALTGWFRSITE